MNVTVNKYRDRFLEAIRKSSLDPTHWDEEWIFMGVPEMAVPIVI